MNNPISTVILYPPASCLAGLYSVSFPLVHCSSKAVELIILNVCYPAKADIRQYPYAFCLLVIANVQFYIDGPIDSEILQSNNDRAVFLEGFVLD